MTSAHLLIRAGTYLRLLCEELPSRHVGGAGNREATSLFASAVAGFGFDVATPGFDCIDWAPGGVSLTVAGEAFPAWISPYSPPVRARAPLAVVTTVEELAAAQLAGAVALLRGPIAAEQLMPKNFPFYNPEEHQRIVGLLEAQGPAAIVTALARGSAMAGGLYPAPMFEDGDFTIPSVYLGEEDGERLAACAGREVALTIGSERRPARGCNVVARRGPAAPRVVVCAHIDAKKGTPGALDNASGITVLLLLAELLRAYDGRLGVEIVALNGEDNYANPGELLYLAQNAGRFEEIVLGINLDGVGYHEGDTAYSLYACPEELAAVIHAALARPGIAEGPPWYQGDHGLFILNQRPALALTSARAFELLASVIHTAEDRPALVDPARLAQVAEALAGLVVELGR